MSAPFHRAPASPFLRLLLAVNVWLGRLLSLPVVLYRVLISPALPRACRFEPSCSVYSARALQRHGVWPGVGLTLRRLSRCHPWGGSGFDPVPERGPTSPSSHVPSTGTPELPGEIHP